MYLHSKLPILHTHPILYLRIKTMSIKAIGPMQFVLRTTLQIVFSVPHPFSLYHILFSIINDTLRNNHKKYSSASLSIILDYRIANYKSN